MEIQLALDGTSVRNVYVVADQKLEPVRLSPGGVDQISGVLLLNPTL